MLRQQFLICSQNIFVLYFRGITFLPPLFLYISTLEITLENKRLKFTKKQKKKKKTSKTSKINPRLNKLKTVSSKDPYIPRLFLLWEDWIETTRSTLQTTDAQSKALSKTELPVFHLWREQQTRPRLVTLKLNFNNKKKKKKNREFAFSPVQDYFRTAPPSLPPSSQKETAASSVCTNEKERERWTRG